MSSRRHGFDWRGVRLAVFDVDGTLYDQQMLRRRMVWALVTECLRRPGQARSLRVISRFRRSREQLAMAGAAGVGDLQFQIPARDLGLTPEEVRRVIEEWMEQRPLAYLSICRFPAAGPLMQTLRKAGVLVAAWSDYPTCKKLETLGLRVDLQVSAADPEVDRLKPHPTGLQRLLDLTSLEPAQTVMIGDREDRDGEAARRAGVPCLIKTTRRPRRDHEFRGFDELLDSFQRSAAQVGTLQ